MAELHPDADVTDGGWLNEASGSTLNTSIDEATINDSDYIRSIAMPLSDVCEVALGDPGGTPVKPMTVSYRFKKGGVSGGIHLVVSLVQGSTVIASWSENNIPTSFVSITKTLTDAEFALISDFTDLRLRFESTAIDWWLSGSAVDLDFVNARYRTDAAYTSFDPYIVTLLHFDGADASTTFHNGFAKDAVPGGSVQIDTAQSKFGGASGLFNGTTDFLNIDGIGGKFAFGLGDFTIDFWVRLNSVSGFRYPYEHPASTGDSLRMYWSGTLFIVSFSFTFNDLVANMTFTTGQWYHIAVVRASGVGMVFVDGVKTPTTFDASAFNYGPGDTNGLCIGSFANGTANFLNGWLDEYRVIKGVAVWTETFTPPAAPYADLGPYDVLSCSRASIGYAQTEAGALTKFATNEFRITSLGLLVEEARTNLCLYSQAISGWSTSGSNATLADNQTAAPDGTTTAEGITVNSSNSFHFGYRSDITVATNTYTFSMYCKAREYGFFCFGAEVDAGKRYAAIVNLSTGAVTDTHLTASAPTVVTAAAVEILANGWYRVYFTLSITAGTAGILWGPSNSATPTWDAGQNMPTWTGDGTSGVYGWGMQCELGVFATSYIPTTNVAATRAADGVFGIDVLSTVPVAAAGSAYADVKILDATTGNFTRFLGSTTDHELIGNNGNDTTAITFRGGGGGILAGGAATGGRLFTTGMKTAVGWDGSGRSVVGGGGSVGTDANSMNPNALVIGSANGAGTQSFINGYIRRAAFWATRLADATLQGFTT